jgi:hypothetical protein
MLLGSAIDAPSASLRAAARSSNATSAAVWLAIVAATDCLTTSLVVTPRSVANSTPLGLVGGKNKAVIGRRLRLSDHAFGPLLKHFTTLRIHVRPARSILRKALDVCSAIGALVRSPATDRAVCSTEFIVRF